MEQNASARYAPSPSPAAATPPCKRKSWCPEQVEQNVPAAVAPSRLQPRVRHATRAERGNCATEQVEPTGEAVASLSPLARRTSTLSRANRARHNSGRQAARRSAGKSVLLCTCFVWISGWSAVPRDRPRGGFAHIQDLKSSASGWIDEAALARPPRDPAASAPAQPMPFSGRACEPVAAPKPTTTHRHADSEQPLSRIAGALAYSVEGVSSGEFRQRQLVMA